MARRKRLEGVVDRFLVSGADRPVVHVIRKLRARGLGKLGHVWLANGVKVRTEASDEPLQPDLCNGVEQRKERGIEDWYLKGGGCDQTLQKPHGCGQEIIETPSTDLKEDEKDKGRDERDERRQPNGNNLLSNWVGILRVDDVPIWMENGKRSVGCGG
jgi:hypothetical protein